MTDPTWNATKTEAVLSSGSATARIIHLADGWAWSVSLKATRGILAAGMCRSSKLALANARMYLERSTL